MAANERHNHLGMNGIAFPDISLADEPVHNAIIRLGESSKDGASEAAAYLRAARSCPNVIMAESPPAQFLAFEQHDVAAAARLLAFHWRLRAEVLGDPAAFLPFAQSLTEEEKALIADGAVGCVLPPKKTGQYVCFIDLSSASSSSSSSEESRLKLQWVIAQTLGLKIWSQFASTRNFEAICMCLLQKATDSPPGSNLLDMRRFQSCCVRVTEMHSITISSDDFGTERARPVATVDPVAMRALGEIYGPDSPRSIIHDGCAVHVLEELKACGFQEEHLPVAVGGKWSSETVWQAWIASSCLSRASSTAAAQAVGAGAVEATRIRVDELPALPQDEPVNPAEPLCAQHNEREQTNSGGKRTKLSGSKRVSEENATAGALPESGDSEADHEAQSLRLGSPGLDFPVEWAGTGAVEPIRIPATPEEQEVINEIYGFLVDQQYPQVVEDMEDASTRTIEDKPNHPVLDAVSTLTQKDAGAFWRAYSYCPQVVQSESPLESYLLLGRGNRRVAAERLATYWSIRELLFGTDYAYLPMAQALRLYDFSILMRGEAGFVLSSSPNRGRPVLFLDGSIGMEHATEDLTPHLRVMSFLLHTMCDMAPRCSSGISEMATAEAICLCYLDTYTLETLGDEISPWIGKLIQQAVCIEFVELHIVVGRSGQGSATRRPEGDDAEASHGVAPSVSELLATARTRLESMLSSATPGEDRRGNRRKLTAHVHFGSSRDELRRSLCYSTTSSLSIDDVPDKCGGTLNVETYWPEWLQNNECLQEALSRLMVSAG